MKGTKHLWLIGCRFHIQFSVLKYFISSYLQSLQKQAAELQQQKLAGVSLSTPASTCTRKRSADAAFASDGELVLLGSVSRNYCYRALCNNNHSKEFIVPL